MGLSWMAWTGPTAGFFVFIGICFAVMSVWEYASPGGGPRHGILGLDTTRGDRLFITLLGSAFINLIWLGLEVGPQPWALLVCLVYAAAVFRWV